MRIAVIGANGQVASEVALLLRARPEVELRPLVRSRGGSAFLRYHGIPVAHVAITSPAAQAAMTGCDVIANFALAGGTPAAAKTSNDAIIRATFDQSPPNSTVVFFSTAAVFGQWDSRGTRRTSAYGDLKLGNEALVAELAKAQSRNAYTLRLGHVCGPHQGITGSIRSEILTPPVLLPDPDRAANVTYTTAIAEALLAIGAGRAGPPGRYDLFNQPQWTWREVYEWEAQAAGRPAELVAIDGGGGNAGHLGTRVRHAAFRTIGRLGLRDRLMRLAAKMPAAINETARAEYYVNQARGEIAGLSSPASVRNTAAYWPAIEPVALGGLRTTRDLMTSREFERPDVAHPRWPTDLAFPAKSGMD